MKLLKRAVHKIRIFIVPTTIATPSAAAGSVQQKKLPNRMNP